MTPEYAVFVNNLWFDRLNSSEHYQDRPEFFRQHEKALWTIFQLLRAGGHRVSITTPARQLVAEFTGAPAFAAWVAGQYPGLAAQLSEPRYSRFAHPQDALRPPGGPC